MQDNITKTPNTHYLADCISRLQFKSKTELRAMVKPLKAAGWSDYAILNIISANMFGATAEELFDKDQLTPGKG